MSNVSTHDRPEASLAERIRLLFSQVFALSTLGPLLALLLAGAFFASQTNRFLTGPNLSLVVQQVMVVGTLAIALLACAGTERFLQLRVSRNYMFGWAVAGIVIALLASVGALTSIAESFADAALAYTITSSCSERLHVKPSSTLF